MKKGECIVLKKILIIIISIILITIIVTHYANTMQKVEFLGDIIEVVESDNELKLIPIILSSENETYKYDVYYYGLKKVNIKYKGKFKDLKEILLSEKMHIDDIIDIAKQDENNKKVKTLVVLDGGTKEFIYPDFTIIKSINNNVYILKSGLHYGSIK